MSNSFAQSCLDSVLEPLAEIPIAIDTYFLGSGKTTLINHILNNWQSLKVAVTMSKFGDVDIDSQLLVAVN
jgi:G3E family GTPase